jgi:hypothetical protein
MVLALAKACEASAPGCGPCGAAGGGKCANAKENGGHALRTIHDKRTRTFVSRRSAPCGRAHTDMRTTEGTKEGTTIFASSRKFSPRDAQRRADATGRFLRAPHRAVPGVAGCVQAPGADGATSLQPCPVRSGRPSALTTTNCFCPTVEFQYWYRKLLNSSKPSKTRRNQTFHWRYRVFTKLRTNCR